MSVPKKKNWTQSQPPKQGFEDRLKDYERKGKDIGALQRSF